MSINLVRQNIVSTTPDADRWVMSELKSIYTVPPSSPDYVKKRLRELLVDENLQATTLSNYYRLTKYIRDNQYDLTEYVCTVFSVARRGIKVKYGLMFSGPQSPFLTPPHQPKRTQNLFPDYFTVAPALNSVDGEYRSRIYTFPKQQRVWQLYQDVRLYIEEYITNKIQTGELEFTYENFNPTILLAQSANVMADLIAKHRAQLLIYLQFWIVELYNVTVGLQENHINPKTNLVVFSNTIEDRKCLNQLFKLFGRDRITDMVYLLSINASVIHVNGKLMQSRTPFCIGQKLIPMNVGDAQHPFDITYKVWRELYVSYRVSELVADFVCGTYPLIVGWGYIKSAKPGLFDNDAQLARLKTSESARSVVNKLRETKYLIDRESTDNVLPDISAEFDNQIQRIESTVLISNVTMYVLSENVGRTMADVPVLERRSKLWCATLGSLLQDHVRFSKHVFDICYGLVCMNVRLGVVHCDLHLNNMSININTMYYPRAGSRVAYEVNNNWYVFDCNAHNTYIIDYSRATIHPDNIMRYVQRHKKQMPTASVELFVTLQHERMIKTLMKHFPNYYSTHMVQVRETLIANFTKFYKLFSMVDTYNMSDLMHKHFSQFACNKKNLELLVRIKRTSEYYLTVGMSNLFTNPDTDVDWPAYALISECFSDNVLAERDMEHVIDIWSCSRVLKSDLEHMSGWPDYLNKMYVIKTTSDKPVKNENQMNVVFARDSEKYRENQLKVLKLISDRHKLKFA